MNKVAFADVSIRQNDSLLTKGKTDFEGRSRQTFTPLNYTDSITIEITKSPFLPQDITYLPQSERMSVLEFEMFTLSEENEHKKWDKDGPIVPKYFGINASYNRGLGIGIGFGLFGIIEQGNFLDGGIFIGHGLGGNLGIEANWNNSDFMLGPKLTAEYHWLGAFIGAKLSAWYLTNFTEGTFKFTPEVGFSAFGFGYAMIGYNFGLSDDFFSTIDGWRLSIGVNIPLL